MYVDHDVAVDVADLLSAAGFPSATTRDLGLAEARDHVQMVTAWERSSVLVTHNQKDFVELFETWQLWPRRWGLADPPPHPGVIVLQQVGADELAAALAPFLGAGHPLENRLYRWRVALGWQQWVTGQDWVSFP